MTSTAGPKTVGLTGTIGSGKSVVAAMLAARGFATLDADQLARRVTEPGSPGLAKVIEVFGAAILDAGGRLDRRALADRAFRTPEARHALEAILHPLIRAALAGAVRALSEAGAPLVVVEASMILESGEAGAYDMMVLVTAPVAVKVERAVARGMRGEDVENRLRHQWPDAVKAKSCHWIIPNSGTLRALEEEVEVLARALTEWVSSPGPPPVNVERACEPRAPLDVLPPPADKESDSDGA